MTFFKESEGEVGKTVQQKKLVRLRKKLKHFRPEVLTSEQGSLVVSHSHFGSVV